MASKSPYSLPKPPPVTARPRTPGGVYGEGKGGIKRAKLNRFRRRCAASDIRYCCDLLCDDVILYLGSLVILQVLVKRSEFIGATHELVSDTSHILTVLSGVLTGRAEYSPMKENIGSAVGKHTTVPYTLHSPHYGGLKLLLKEHLELMLVDSSLLGTSRRHVFNELVKNRFSFPSNRFPRIFTIFNNILYAPVVMQMVARRGLGITPVIKSRVCVCTNKTDPCRIQGRHNEPIKVIGDLLDLDQIKSTLTKFLSYWKVVLVMEHLRCNEVSTH
ncbi:hypothetical protein J6590_013948 [Homalodisca vitripennis]|nr:hypothetical protein J6590_013948 [Homalodisca vitripennis]